MEASGLESNYSQIPGKIIVSACELNQWALDFDGNYKRIEKSIIQSKEKGATYRLGPELEITGYNCQDHFLEIDTINHTYEVLATILANKNFYGIVLDVGLPLIHNGVRYNCRALCFNGNLICIRPKTVLANDGCYHEERWFVSWKKRHMEEWHVPEVIYTVIKKVTVPIGVCILQFGDVNIGIEMCEELFVPNSIHNLLALNGADIICNGNGSHFQISKIFKRFSLVTDASGKAGCAYMYANLQGCDGCNMYFDGGSFIASCGKIVNMNKRFTINDGCIIVCAIIDVEEMRSKRGAIVSWSTTAAQSEVIHKIIIQEKLCRNVDEYLKFIPGSLKHHDEIMFLNTDINEELLGPPICFLWDYLRRSNSRGFFVALSGGADSSCVCCIVYYLAYQIYHVISDTKNLFRQEVLQELRNIIRDQTFYPESEKDICNRILFTAYMGSENSSNITKERAKLISQFINSNHYDVDISKIYKETIQIASTCLNVEPKFSNFGGSSIEDLSLQNVQARIRLLLSYFISQLAPFSQKSSSTGNSAESNNLGCLLVLGTSNADECVRGYFTKYDNSSGDISPIGSLGKREVNQILKFMQERFEMKILADVLLAQPSAELTPLLDGLTIQSDEVDMGFTYLELSRIRELRNISLCGPLSMFYKLLEEWKSQDKAVETRTMFTSPKEIADKVKRFFVCYGINRHKSTILPPPIHLSATAVDGKQFDMRPFLYNILWSWQFRCIDNYLKHQNV